MKLRIAMVGCGRIAQVYKESFKALRDQVEVCYAVDIKKERADAFAENFQGCKSITDYKECLDDSIDVLHIATPHYCHMSIAIEEMKHHIHVLTEKPIAIYLQDARSMIQGARDNNVKLGVIFQTRYATGYKAIKDILKSGKIGRILGARSYLSWQRLESYYKESDWKGTWDLEGGGILIDQAIHSIDRVLDLIGDEVVKVEGSIANRHHPSMEVEDTAEASVYFKNGVSYQLYASNGYAYDAPIYIEIVGDAGKVSLVQDKAIIEIKGQKTYEVTQSRKKQVGEDYWGICHQDQLEDFYRSVRENIGVKIDGEEGYKTLEVVRGIYHAAIKGKAIELPFEDEKIISLRR